MPERRFQDIWKEQCQAARGVRQRLGVVSALDYLIGEKLMDFAEMAVTRPEFARELPSFVAEIPKILSAEESRVYVEHVERMHVLEEEALSTEPPDDDVHRDTGRARSRDRATSPAERVPHLNRVGDRVERSPAGAGAHDQVRKREKSP
jgi:hypothetical protein